MLGPLWSGVRAVREDEGEWLLAALVTGVLAAAAREPREFIVFRFAGLLPGWRGVAGAFAVNLVTHPVVWQVLSAHPGAWWFAAAEASACLVEGALLGVLRRGGRAVLGLAGLVANTTSATAGLLLG